MKSMCLVLIASVGCLAVVQPSAEAMLVPARAIESAPSLSRPADLQTVQTALESKIIREKLHALGLSDAEIQARLARLSDRQIHQLASQIRAVHPAGDFLVGILVIAVLVLLIIFLAKRI